MLKQEFRDVQRRRTEKRRGRKESGRRRGKKATIIDQTQDRNWKKIKTTAVMKKKKYEVSMGEENQMKS